MHSHEHALDQSDKVWYGWWTWICLVDCHVFNAWMFRHAYPDLPCNVSALGDVCLHVMIDEWLGLGWLCHVDCFRCMFVCVYVFVCVCVCVWERERERELE